MKTHEHSGLINPQRPDPETTRRIVNPGAEKWLYEVIPVLDHGFIYLVDYMGSDEAIEQAARVSYGTGTRATSATRTLLRYLWSHAHTSPFEMAELKFHAKMPIFVARQWIRHRTANINEYSGRYSILDRDFYLPQGSALAAQSSDNKQGRDRVLSAEEAEAVRELLARDAELSYSDYEFLLNDDGNGNPIDPNRSMLARELARINLSLNFYTQWYWKIDLRNLLHFENLRMDQHAQYEIREYANAISTILEDAFPITWEAFRDYSQGATSLSRQEREFIVRLIELSRDDIGVDEAGTIAEQVGLTNKREKQEVLNKAAALGLIR